MDRAARPGSHSSRPKRAGFAAHEHSIAAAAAVGKTAERDNDALQREKCNGKAGKTGSSRGTDGAIGGAGALLAALPICGERTKLGPTRAKIRSDQRDKPIKILSRCPIACAVGV